MHAHQQRLSWWCLARISSCSNAHSKTLVQGHPTIGELGESLEFPQWERNQKPIFVISSRVPGRRKLRRELAQLQAMYAETRREVKETNLLRRPISERELETKLGSLWVPSRRFGLRQSTNIRPIDDLGHNFTLGTDFKIDLGGMDEV